MNDVWDFYKDVKNEWRWKRVAPNGQIVGASHEGYINKEDCVTNAVRHGMIVMDTEPELKLYHHALGTFGREAQLGILQEECAELIVAASKLLREGKQKSSEDANEAFYKELADVNIMTNQMLTMIGDTGVAKMKHYKTQALYRLEDRIRERLKASGPDNL